MRICLLKNMPVLLFFFFTGLYGYGQGSHRVKPWKATVFFEQGRPHRKIKGRLYTVSDTSLVIHNRRGKPDEILFRDIDRIRLVKDHGRTGRRIAGPVVGAVAGAVIASAALTKNKEGESRALSGVVGGIGGGLIGAGVGALATPVVYNLFSQKKFRIIHDPLSYQQLKSRLQAYAVNNQ